MMLSSAPRTDPPPYADNFMPVVRVDRRIHTPECPHCWDTDCPCFGQLKEELAQHYQDGLVSANDATRILHGNTRYEYAA